MKKFARRPQPSKPASSLAASLQSIMRVHKRRMEHQARQAAAEEREAERQRRALVAQREAERIRAEDAMMHRLIEEHRQERAHREQVRERARAARESVLARARRQLESRVRREEVQRRQHHEQKMNQLRRNPTQLGLKAGFGILVIAASLAAVVGLSAREHLESRNAQERAALQEEAQRHERQAAVQVHELLDELAHAQSLALTDKLRLERQLDEARQELERAHREAAEVNSGVALQSQVAHEPAPAPRKRVSEPPKLESSAPVASDEPAVEQQCLPGDPLCFSL